MTVPLPPTLIFPFPEIPSPGRVIEVAPGVRWLRLPLPFALDVQQQFFAMGEAVAHLNHLWHHGRAHRESGPDGVIRFTSIQSQE